MGVTRGLAPVVVACIALLARTQTPPLPPPGGNPDRARCPRCNRQVERAGVMCSACERRSSGSSGR